MVDIKQKVKTNNSVPFDIEEFKMEFENKHGYPLFDENPTSSSPIQTPKKQSQRKLFSIKKMLFTVAFYTTLLAFLLSVWLLSSQSGLPKNVLGFSGFTVLTSSMQREIPQGSFVITQQVDVSTLEIGDDITYFKNADTTVTHKIVAIKENYFENGNIGFVTRGIENENNDEEVVSGENIVGKVIFHNLVLGQVFTYIRDNLLIVGLITGEIIILITALRFYRKASPHTKKNIQQLHRLK